MSGAAASFSVDPLPPAVGGVVVELVEIPGTLAVVEPVLVLPVGVCVAAWACSASRACWSSAACRTAKVVVAPTRHAK